MSDKPVIFIAFANEKADESTKLRLLSQERQAIEDALDKEHCEIVVVESTSPDDIFKKFNDKFYAGRIAVFHYAGHANSFGILLEDHQSSTGNTHFRAEGLVDFLAQQQSLKLVFLNACSTKAQAIELQQKGIPNVIATRQSINDAVAAELAQKFYTAISSKKSIERALTEAGSMIKGKSHGGAFRDLVFEGMEEDASEASTGIPWDLYGLGDWWIGADSGKGLIQQLQQHSKKCYQDRKALHDEQTFVTNDVKQWVKRTTHVLGKSMRLSQMLPNLWKEDRQKWNALILGNPGAGKTSSMLHIWMKLLENDERPIPIYIPLSEYNQSYQRDKGKFILSYILREYFDKPYGDEQLADALVQWLKHPQESADGSVIQPLVILLLDGLNEITVDKSLLVAELKEWSDYPNTQTIVSSRMTASLSWAADYHRAQLEGIQPAKIVEFLDLNNVPIPSNPRLLELLQNPLMLSMYTRTSDMPSNRHIGVIFKSNPSTQGELLHNFMAANLSSWLDKNENDVMQQHLYRWIFLHLLPRIAYEMEHYLSINTESSHELSRQDFKQTIKDVLEELADEVSLEYCIEAFPDTEGFWDAIIDEELPRPDFAQLRKIIEDDLQLIVKRNGRYQFSQAIFRDYLSAVHLINEAMWGIYMGEVPECWKERVFPKYMIQMIGELEGDYKNMPVFQNGEWRQAIKTNTLHALLDTCRNLFPDWQTTEEEEEEDVEESQDEDIEDGHDSEKEHEHKEGESVHKATWNILNIWKAARNNMLTGENFNDLDLYPIPLFNTVFSMPGLIPASFEGTYMDEQCWLSKGHFLGVNSLTYSADGHYVLSGSDDCTVREWGLNSGECFVKLEGHDDAVLGAWYTDDEKLIVSVDIEGVVKVWQMSNEECLWTLQAEDIKRGQGIVVYPYAPEVLIRQNGKVVKLNCRTQAIEETNYDSQFIPFAYNSDASWVVGLQEDKHIALYNSDGVLWEPLIKHGHKAPIICLAVNFDAYRVLSIDADGHVKEWDTDNGSLISEWREKTIPTAISYHPKGDKFLSFVAGAETAFEHDIRTHAQREIGFHQVGIAAIAYHPEGHKIVTASSMGQICEWDIKTLQLSTKIDKGYSMSLLTSILKKKTLSVKTLQKKGSTAADLSFHFISSIDYSLDGDRGIWASEDGVLQEWDLINSTCLSIIQAHELLISHCVYANEEYAVTASVDGTAKLWFLPQMHLVKTYTHGGAISALAIDRIGGVLMTGGSDGKLKVWDWQKGTCIYEELIHQGGVSDLYMHPSKRLMLSSGADGIIKEWDTDGGLCRYQSESLEADIPAVCYEASGEMAIFGTASGTWGAWAIGTSEIAEGEPLMDINQKDKNIPTGISDIAFSEQTGSVLCSTQDGAIRQFNASTGEEIQTIHAHLGYVMAVRYSPDGQRGLSSALDGSVKEWDLATGKCINAFPCLKWPVHSCNFHYQRAYMSDELISVLQMYGAIFEEEEMN